MVSMMLRSLVMASLDAPDAVERFEDRAFELARDQGVDLRAEDVAGLEDLAEKYVRETLRLFESCVTAADQARASDLFRPVIAACERFFLQPAPGIEDPRGLYGMICHCYASRALLAMVSERARGVRGFPLFASSPNAEADVIVSLIGPDQAASVDRIVETAVATPAVRFALNSAYRLAGALRATGRLSEWDARWEDVTRAFGDEIGLRLSPAAARAPNPGAGAEEWAEDDPRDASA